MSSQRNRFDARDRKARPGGCFVVAAQRARIARKKGGASDMSAKGILSGLLFEHGLLTALMAAGQMMGALTQAAVGAVFGFIANIGRGSPGAFQAPREASAAASISSVMVASAGASPRRSRPGPDLAAGHAGRGGRKPSLIEAQAHPEAQPSPGYARKGAANAAARAESQARFGNPEVFEWVYQKINNNLEAPISKYVKGIPASVDKVSPEVFRLLSKDTNNVNSDSFRSAKAMLANWLRANPGYSGACAARAIFGDLVELQRSQEEAARQDPTKGPAMIGPGNDGGEGDGAARLKTPRDESMEPPPPSPFKL